MSERPVEGGTRFTLTPTPRSARTEIRVGRGLLDGLPALLADRVPAPAYAVVSDDNVAPLHGERVADAIADAGSAARLLTFPAGEASKTPARWEALLEELAGMGLGRDGCVVAVGGGVTGDLAGFAAAAYARGVRLVQVPTSLLAMIDAAIGGKTGLDLRAGKNLAGAFHHPDLVVADPAVLETLPPAELRAGLAEAVKHGAIADLAYLDALEADAVSILELDPEAVDAVVAGSVRIKTDVVARDALEAGERAVLNFGHTIAHGVERTTAYAVPHGQAVAIGMVAEARIGEGAGITTAGTTDRLRAALSGFGLPTAVPDHLDAGALIAAAGSDKKAREGRVRYALLRAPGEAARRSDGEWTHVVDEAIVIDALVACGARAPQGGPV